MTVANGRRWQNDGLNRSGMDYREANFREENIKFSSKPAQKP